MSENDSAARKADLSAKIRRLEAGRAKVIARREDHEREAAAARSAEEEYDELLVAARAELANLEDEPAEATDE